MCVCVSIYVCIYTYVYIYIYINTYICIQQHTAESRDAYTRKTRPHTIAEMQGSFANTVKEPYKKRASFANNLTRLGIFCERAPPKVCLYKRAC